MSDLTIKISERHSPDLATRLLRPVDPSLQAEAVKLAEELQKQLQPYPPENEGNRPHRSGRSRTLRWYERGYGARWQRRDGSIGGHRSSERMGSRWHVSADPRGARLQNDARYSGWVQSTKEQTTTHKKHGWKTVEAGKRVVLQRQRLRKAAQTIVQAITR